jgi:hypothetical protein
MLGRDTAIRVRKGGLDNGRRPKKDENPRDPEVLFHEVSKNPEDADILAEYGHALQKGQK